MPLLHDEIFPFPGWHGCESHCRMQIFLPPDEARQSDYIVLLTDDLYATGTSITNASEQLAAVICAKHCIPEDRVQFIEHYDFRGRGPGHDGSGHTETFARVCFVVPSGAEARAAYVHRVSLGQPQWSHTDRQSVEVLIGEPLP